MKLLNAFRQPPCFAAAALCVAPGRPALCLSPPSVACSPWKLRYIRRACPPAGAEAPRSHLSQLEKTLATAEYDLFALKRADRSRLRHSERQQMGRAASVPFTCSVERTSSEALPVASNWWQNASHTWPAPKLSGTVPGVQLGAAARALAAARRAYRLFGGERHAFEPFLVHRHPGRGRPP